MRKCLNQLKQYIMQVGKMSYAHFVANNLKYLKMHKSTLGLCK